MSCLQNTQALPPQTVLTAGLTGQLSNQVMWQSYLPESHRIVTFDSSHQSPFDASQGSCYKTPNGVCLGNPNAGVPWMPASGAQMQFMKSMYTPYVGTSLSTPGSVAMQLAASRGPTTSGCAYKFLDAMPL